MATATLFFYLFALLGVFSVTALLYYLWLNYSYNSGSTIAWPPNKFMRAFGLKCPDSWKYVGQLPTGESVCVNEYDIAVNNPGSCYSDQTNRVATFDPISHWPLSHNKRKSDLKSRCDWIKQCGTQPGMKAIWSGVAEYC